MTGEGDLIVWCISGRAAWRCQPDHPNEKRKHRRSLFDNRRFFVVSGTLQSTWAFFGSNPVSVETSRKMSILESQVSFFSTRSNAPKDSAHVRDRRPQC